MVKHKEKFYFLLIILAILCSRCVNYKQKILIHKQEYDLYLAKSYKPFKFEYIKHYENNPKSLTPKNPYLITHFDSTNFLSQLLLDTLILNIKNLPNIDTLKFNYGIRSQWLGTINYNLREPEYVIIHHTAQNSCLQTLKTFTIDKTKVSSHYLICKDGKIYQMLSDYLRAWHAGIGSWNSIIDMNSVSVGIELDNNGFEPFDVRQIQSLIKLLTLLKNKYKISTSNFIGHADIAPIRKNDPNIFFPWGYLAEKGFGLWPDFNDSSKIELNLPKNLALQFIGYDVKDSLAAWRTFKRHFIRDTSSRITTDYDNQVLKSIILKKYKNEF